MAGTIIKNRGKTARPIQETPGTKFQSVEIQHSRKWMVKTRDKEGADGLDALI